MLELLEERLSYYKSCFYWSEKKGFENKWII